MNIQESVKPAPEAEFRIKNSEFTISASEKSGFVQDELSQIAFVGKSNVGKSSLINSLLNRKGLAKTSQMPGKTRLVNYFLINAEFYFVDLPGYGYAKIPESEKVKWQHLVGDYLLDNPRLKLAVTIIDIRHSAMEHDLSMIEWFDHYNIPQLVVLNKADKLSNNQLAQQKRYYKEILKKYKDTQIVEYSTVSHKNRDTMLEIIRQKLEG